MGPDCFVGQLPAVLERRQDDVRRDRRPPERVLGLDTLRLAAQGRPELWDPDGGGRRTASARAADGATDVELELGPWQALHVVFEPGDGPLDAAFKAIEAATGIAVVLRKFEVHAVSEGEDAQGEARVYVEYNHKTYRGASVSTNIVESGTRAFLEVINRIELAQAGARVREERSATTPA